MGLGEKLIGALVQYAGDSLLIQVGQAVQMEAEGKLAPVSAKPIGAEQFDAILAELSDGLDWHREGSASFAITSNGRSFFGGVMLRDGQPTLTVHVNPPLGPLAMAEVDTATTSAAEIPHVQRTGKFDATATSVAPPTAAALAATRGLGAVAESASPANASASLGGSSSSPKFGAPPAAASSSSPKFGASPAAASSSNPKLGAPPAAASPSSPKLGAPPAAASPSSPKLSAVPKPAAEAMAAERSSAPFGRARSSSQLSSIAPFWNDLANAMYMHGVKLARLVSGQLPWGRTERGWAPLHGVGLQSADGLRAAVQAAGQELVGTRGVEVLAVDTAQGRLRVRLCLDTNGPVLSLRLIERELRTPAELGFGPSLHQLFAQTGLIVFSACPDGGRSSTLGTALLAAVQERGGPAVLLEACAEHDLSAKHPLISQREIGRHVSTLSTALQDTRGENIEIVAIDTLTGAEAVRLSLELADTGRLVLAGVGASSVSSALELLLGETTDSLSRGRLARSLLAVTQLSWVTEESGRRLELHTVLRSPRMVRAIEHAQPSLVDCD